MKRTATTRIRRVPHAPALHTLAPVRRTATDALIDSLSILREENGLLQIAAEISARAADAMLAMDPMGSDGPKVTRLAGIIITARDAARMWRRTGADAAESALSLCSRSLDSTIAKMGQENRQTGCPECGAHESACLWQGQHVLRCDTCHSARPLISGFGGGFDA